LRGNFATPLYKTVTSEGFKSVTGERNHAGDWPFHGVIRDLSPAPAKECSRSLLSKSVSVQEIHKFLRRPALLRKGLDGVCRHHQILTAPRHGITILGNDAGQKETFIPQGPIYFVTEDSGTYVNQVIITAGPRSLGPLYPKQEVGKRSNARHPGKGNPAINDVILAH
jgi:hypothetical protein